MSTMATVIKATQKFKRGRTRLEKVGEVPIAATKEVKAAFNGTLQNGRGEIIRQAGHALEQIPSWKHSKTQIARFVMALEEDFGDHGSYDATLLEFLCASESKQYAELCLTPGKSANAIQFVKTYLKRKPASDSTLPGSAKLMPVVKEAHQGESCDKHRLNTASQDHSAQPGFPHVQRDAPEDHALSITAVMNPSDIQQVNMASYSGELPSSTEEHCPENRNSKSALTTLGTRSYHAWRHRNRSHSEIDVATVQDNDFTKEPPRSAVTWPNGTKKGGVLRRFRFEEFVAMFYP